MARDKSYKPKKEVLREIENRFSYHPPQDDQYERYEWVRDHFKSLAVKLTEICPESRELSTALTHLEQAQFYANASIARNE